MTGRYHGGMIIKETLLDVRVNAEMSAVPGFVTLDRFVLVKSIISEAAKRLLNSQETSLKDRH